MAFFDPHKNGIPFKKFREQRKRLKRLVKKYQQLRDEGHSREASFLYAFIHTHRTPAGMSTDLGTIEFVRAMSRALDSAEEMVNHVAEAHLGPYAERSKTLEDIANETDPCKLLEIVCLPKPRATTRNPRVKERRLWDEAERNLIIALQLRVIEINDSRTWVAKDLSDIAELADACLFNGQMPQVWMVAELDASDDDRVRGMKRDPVEPELRVFLQPEPWEQECARLRSAGALMRTEEVPCRIVETDTCRYVVWVKNRRKRERPRLIKLEREGILRDSRGWKYVVVGVQPLHGGNIRMANREDALAFNEHTRRVLWQNRLHQMTDDRKLNRFSDRRYWDVKVNGYFDGDHEGRRVVGYCEQIVTSIADHISVESSRGDDSHVCYAGRRALEAIAPIWFSHVGVNWKSERVREVLEAYWRSHAGNGD